MKFTTCLLTASLMAAGGAHAQGWLSETVPWQFQTSADHANKALVNDIIEKKKGGYYNAFQSTYITNIDRQVNCNFQPTSAGNSNANSQDSRVSSPEASSAAGNTATSQGNSSQSSDNLGRGGVANNDQTNAGAISSGVSGSPSSSTMAPINAGYGEGTVGNQTSQNNGGNQTTSVADSSACAFAGGSLN